MTRILPASLRPQALQAAGGPCACKPAPRSPAMMCLRRVQAHDQGLRAKPPSSGACGATLRPSNWRQGPASAQGPGGRPRPTPRLKASLHFEPQTSVCPSARNNVTSVCMTERTSYEPRPYLMRTARQLKHKAATRHQGLDQHKAPTGQNREGAPI